MNLLITGGAGFIGSHLTDRLLAQGHAVICADKLEMGNQNIRHLEACSRFRFYHMDVAVQENTDRLFRENQIDAVYHLAANSDIQKGGKEPEIDFHDTFLTTRTLLEGMRKAGVKKLFFASTSAVYGDMPDAELTETTGGLMPVSYYGGAKLASEALISSYAAMEDFCAVIFRFPNVAGPGLTHGVIFDFIRKLQADDKTLQILGDGRQCKPYIYVLDLIDAVVRLTGQWKTGERVYNISVYGEGTNVTRIAEITAEEMGLSNVKFCYTGGRRGWRGDVPGFRYNISRILEEGWKPAYTSEEAVRKTVQDILGKTKEYAAGKGAGFVS